jgi:hypothetical protein
MWLARLVGAILKGANLAGAILDGVRIEWADLSGANLTATSIGFARIYLTNLEGANFAGARFGFNTLGDIDLSSAVGLEDVEHLGPSLFGVSCFYFSGKGIPESFLRGCGVPAKLITYARSLTSEALDFYTCFISFTETDDAFAGRLYTDLQASGVRCWRWKEDAKIGRTLIRDVDEAVRQYDKLVLVCSRESLNSPAVLRELERALQKEDQLARQGREGEVLFPVRLDNYVLDEWEHYRRADVIKKNIGDFRNWEGHGDYEKVFGRLLRDLRA